MKPGLLRLRLILVLAVAALAIYLAAPAQPPVVQGQNANPTQSAPREIIPARPIISQNEINLMVMQTTLIPISYAISLPYITR